MNVKRVLPPAAAPIPWSNILKASLLNFSRSQSSLQDFQNELKSFFEADFCFLVSSGKAALSLILETLHEMYPHRNEVIIPAFTCYSVPAAIKKAGLKIKLCDFEPGSFDLDRKNLETIAKRTESHNKILCVLPTHLFGLPTKTSTYNQLFNNEVTLIEDAAQAMGTEINGKKLGTLGDIGFFSLGRGKALSTLEGGVIITNRKDIGTLLDKKISALPNYTYGEKITLIIKAIFTTLLQNPRLFWLPKSLPFLRLGETHYEPHFEPKKLSNIHGILADGWKNRLNSHQRTRMTNLEKYKTVQSKMDGKASFPWLQTIYPLIRLPGLAKNSQIRAEILLNSEENGYGLMPSYPTLINGIPELQHEFSDEQFPIAQSVCDRLITLPVHEYVTPKDIYEIFSYRKNSQII